MALTPTITSPQARALAVSSLGASAEVQVPQVRALAAINFPAESIKAAQARALSVVRQPADIQVTQARVLVVARGRFDRPRITAWTITLDNHDFYILQTQDETLVCDLTTGQWHVWGTSDEAKWRVHTGITWRRALANAQDYGSTIVGLDDTYGMVYLMDPEGIVDENPDSSRAALSFKRVVYGQIPLSGRVSVPCYGIELYGSVGEQSSADYVTVELSVSDDQGHTFQSYGTVSVSPGEYSARLDWYSLGQMEAPGRLIKVEDYGALIRIDSMEMLDAES